MKRMAGSTLTHTVYERYPVSLSRKGRHNDFLTSDANRIRRTGSLSFTFPVRVRHLECTNR